MPRSTRSSGASPGSAEDDGRAHLGHDVGADIEAVVSRHRPEEVVDVALGLLVVGDVMTGGVGLVALRERLDLLAHRGGEQQDLTIVTSLLDDATDTWHEAHVSHPVGLVDDEELDLAQVNHPLLDEVFEAPGAGHEDVDALGQGILGRSIAGPAVHGDDLAATIRAKRGQLVSHLGGELTGRLQDEALRASGL